MVSGRFMSRPVDSIWRDGRTKTQSGAQRGFTMVELVVILTLIGTVAVISYVAFDEWIDTYRLNRDSQALASELTMARFRAVSGREDVTFTISGGTGYVATYRFSPGGQQKHLTSSVTISSISGDNPIIFNSRGMASADTTITLLNDEGTTSTVHVNFVGLVDYTAGI